MNLGHTPLEQESEQPREALRALPPVLRQERPLALQRARSAQASASLPARSWGDWLAGEKKQDISRQGRN